MMDRQLRTVHTSTGNISVSERTDHGDGTSSLLAYLHFRHLLTYLLTGRTEEDESS